MNKFNEPYHFDPETNRVALPLEVWEKLDADIPTYFHQTDLVQHGLDPWKVVDQVDKMVDDDRVVELWFENGFMPARMYDRMNVHKLMLYVSIKHLPNDILKIIQDFSQKTEPVRLSKAEEYALIRQNRAIHESAIHCIDAMYFVGTDKFDIDEHLAAIKAKFLEMKE